MSDPSGTLMSISGCVGFLMWRAGEKFWSVIAWLHCALWTIAFLMSVFGIAPAIGDRSPKGGNSEAGSVHESPGAEGNRPSSPGGQIK